MTRSTLTAENLDGVYNRAGLGVELSRQRKLKKDAQYPKGWSQARLAQATGYRVSRPGIAQIENGVVIPTVPVLFVLANALGIDVNTFFRAAGLVNVYGTDSMYPGFSLPPGLSERRLRDLEAMARSLAELDQEDLDLAEEVPFNAPAEDRELASAVLTGAAGVHTKDALAWVRSQQAQEVQAAQVSRGLVARRRGGPHSSGQDQAQDQQTAERAKAHEMAQALAGELVPVPVPVFRK